MKNCQNQPPKNLSKSGVLESGEKGLKMEIEQTKVELTQSKLDLYGVQVTFTINVGDWRRTVAISPISYEVFKRWEEIYSDNVIKSMVKQIDSEIGDNND